MSLDAMRELVKANPDAPDNGHVKVRAFDIVAACDELPADVVGSDKGVRFAGFTHTAKAIRNGSANAMKGYTDPERAEAAVVAVPIGYARHILKLAGG